MDFQPPPLDICQAWLYDYNTKGDISMKIIKEKQDLTYLTWTKIRNSSGTAGSFLKSYTELNGEKTYYKLSNFDSYRGIVGHECINELIIDRLLTLLGIAHLEYQLIHADIMINGNVYETYLCASKDFKEKGDTKIALDAFYQAERLDNETPLDFCIRHGWADYIYTMLVIDFLILNRDRHGANIEVLRNSQKRTLRLAPLFDHGLSLLFQSATNEDLSKIDVMDDKKVQSFVGSSSATENLKLIPTEHLPILIPLKQSDKDLLFEDLENIISIELQNKIWEMLFKRWKYYEDFCNKRCKRLNQ